MGSIKMAKEEIMKIIPHRDPILLVDEVLNMNQGEDITAIFNVKEDMEIFKGHFPGNPVLPGVYTVECMAQVSDILLLSDEKYTGKVPYFIGIDKVRFSRKIAPGDTIKVYAKVIREREEKGIVTCEATVYNKEEVAAVGEVTLAMR